MLTELNFVEKAKEVNSQIFVFFKFIPPTNGCAKALVNFILNNQC